VKSLATVGVDVRDVELVEQPIVSLLGESKLPADGSRLDAIFEQGTDGGSDSQTLFIVADFSRSDSTVCHASPRAKTSSCWNRPGDCR
jgi:hypothetical protein